ncbi:MAG: hypothetical protein WC809_06345 [Sinimarinibacterium sp.]
MKLLSKDGMEMMSIDSLDAQSDKIVIRGKMMKNMPATIHVQPIGLAELFMLLTFRSALRIVGLFFRGLWQYWRQKKSAPATQTPGRP